MLIPLSVCGGSVGACTGTLPAGEPLTVMLSQHDQCESPHFWEMIRRNADRMPMERRDAGMAYGTLPSFS